MRVRIKFNLSPQSVEQAQLQVLAVALNLINMCDQLLEALMQEGLAVVNDLIAQIEVNNDTDHIPSGVVGYYDDSTRTAVIRVNDATAAYIEFGTGVVGARNPYPEEPWPYDVNDHGDKGWFYKGPAGKGVWTKGQPPHMFMYNTRQYLIGVAASRAKAVFGP